MTQAEATQTTAALIESGMPLVQALATTMALGKVAEIEATGYVLTQANLAEIARNARALAEDVVARQQAAQGSAVLANLQA